jgi:hypothetical protein
MEHEGSLGLYKPKNEKRSKLLRLIKISMSRISLQYFSGFCCILVDPGKYDGAAVLRWCHGPAILHEFRE